MPRNGYYSGPVSDHFDGARFHSPGQRSPDRSLRDLLRWQREGVRAKARWPKNVPITPTTPPPHSKLPRLTMVGHASVLIQVAGLNLLTDPVWSDRASPLSFLGPKRVTAPGIDFDKLPQIDAVLLSHNHYDHLDVATLRRLEAKHNPLMVMPLGTDATVRKGVKTARIACADWNDRVALSPDVSVSLTPANHWSSRGFQDRRMALWSGFWIHSPPAQIWFAGDTGYGDGRIFHDIRRRHGAPEIALIPIGAYEPRWFMSDQHVAPEESVRIFNDVGAQQALGFHWGTFQLTDEAREAPKDLLRTSVAAAGIAPDRFTAFGPGDVHAEE
ncbi:L-ascorbate metabolism protein UlaG (beta-lactamase superfamily) [Litoreibacter meonggei]|uniref:L-ascorbate metabolism protein UlaG (Beta-lactamase superfamily) n=1 Tax=Litoreibacter meonggei TaxID=1049199 RepID=A0A497X4J7_9RHOB|nr:MBL fold metallo-hydrolase [Litoreibacter meonggei]RLJ60120.1 L-ascorbate metabolism protein UlaG (beta-lactamase superfamily) [Litoreibacter meonggei]